MINKIIAGVAILPLITSLALAKPPIKVQPPMPVLPDKVLHPKPSAFTPVKTVYGKYEPVGRGRVITNFTYVKKAAAFRPAGVAATPLPPVLLAPCYIVYRQNVYDEFFGIEQDETYINAIQWANKAARFEWTDEIKGNGMTQWYIIEGATFGPYPEDQPIYIGLKSLPSQRPAKVWYRVVLY